MAEPQSSLPSYPSHPGGGEQLGDQRPVHLSTNLAVTALVLSVAGFALLSVITAVPGVILGHKARKKIAAGEAGGAGYATAALWIGYITIVVSGIGGAALLAWYLTDGFA